MPNRFDGLINEDCDRPVDDGDDGYRPSQATIEATLRQRALSAAFVKSAATGLELFAHLTLALARTLRLCPVYCAGGRHSGALPASCFLM